MSITFEAWPKTPRLFRDMVVTEKIDGTNAAVIVEEYAFGTHVDGPPPGVALVLGPDVVAHDGLPAVEYLVAAQSRKRMITPNADNFGFAAWVWEHAADLAHLLGPGRHFGEWWGSGIQRGYGLTNGAKRFSLFNVNRYAGISGVFAELDVVPTLHAGAFDTSVIGDVLNDLAREGSKAAPGFMRPEGVIVYHSAAGQVFKALLENDDKPKGEA